MKLVGTIAAACVAISPAGVSTQAERWRDASVKKSRTVGVAYARCAVRQDRHAVVEYLADPVGTNNPAKLAKALPSECLNRAMGGLALGTSKMELSPLLVRGLLFEALYVRDLKTRQVGSAFELLPPQSYEVAGVDAAGQTLRHDYRALMKIGDCAVRAAPSKVQALLATVAASKGEQRAVAELHDAWTKCLPGRRDLQFSVEMMRATVVEPFYRLTHTLNKSVVESGS